MLAGQADVPLRALSMASTAAPSEAPGARLNEMVVAGNCAEVVDLQRRGRSLDRGDRRQRHLAAARATGR